MPRLKSAIAGRTLILVALAAQSAPVSAQSEVWTAEVAVERALSDPAFDANLDARVRAARAEVARGTTVPTPTLALSHEQVFGGDAVAYAETSVMVAQTVDLTGWRGKLRDTLPDREGMARATVADWRLAVATAVRTAFFEVIYRDQRAAAMKRWTTLLASSTARVSARASRGDAATYDVRRVERELATARARQARESGHLSEAWAALEAWAPWTDRPTLDAVLAPTVSAPQAAQEDLPELVRLERLASALDGEVDAWGSPSLRGWTIAAGYRLANAGELSGHGLLLSLTLPLTLWNNDAPERDRLVAERARVSSELDLARAHAERAERAASERLERTLEALGTLPVPGDEATLTTLAEAAYSSGEASLTELLDAYQSETELTLSVLDLQWEARRAAIELDRRRGLGVPR